MKCSYFKQKMSIWQPQKLNKNGVLREKNQKKFFQYIIPKSVLVEFFFSRSPATLLLAAAAMAKTVCVGGGYGAKVGGGGSAIGEFDEVLGLIQICSLKVSFDRIHQDLKLCLRR